MTTGYHKHNTLMHLGAYEQWVAWKWGVPRDDGKRPKVPINPRTGKNANATDPESWSGVSDALEAVEEYECAGIGFVFTENDPFAGVDLDDCLDAGEVAPWAMKIVEALDSYTEVSPSGTGLKVWVEASKLGDRCRTGNVEMYDSGRFFTFTGERFAGEGVEERQERLSELYRRLFPEPRNTAPARSHDTGAGLGDSLLLEKARASSIGREFEALYDRGDTGGDHSNADYKLMRMLAFWCGKDAGQMERLFTGSALGQRDKWTSRADYRRLTIERACKATSEVHDPQHGKPQQTTREGLHQRMTYALWCHQWREKAGRADAAATDYFAYRALLRTAYRANRTAVDMSVRGLCEAAGIGGHETASDALRRLEDKHGLSVKVAEGGGKDGAATTYRLKAVDAKGDTPLITKNTGSNTSLHNNTCAYRDVWTLLRQTPDLRNSAPQMPDCDKNGRRVPKGEQYEVKRLGKVCAWILDMVYAASAAVSLSFLSERTGIRKNDLKARYINQLIVAGLIKRTEEGYMPTTNVKVVLEEEVEVSGCNDAAKLQRERHDREREAYRTRQEHKPEESVEVEDFEDFSDIPTKPLLSPLSVEGKPNRFDVAAALEELEADCARA